MKRKLHLNKTIDPAHRKPAPPSPHNRDQLRRKLLKMILQNEAHRRGLVPKSRAAPDAGANLAVFDPDDRIGEEFVVIPPKRA